MQAHQRQALMSHALDLRPGRVVNRDTVQAALWHVIGWNAKPEDIGRLLRIIDSYADARVKRALELARLQRDKPGASLPPQTWTPLMTSHDYAGQEEARTALSAIRRDTAADEEREKHVTALREARSSRAWSSPLGTREEVAAHIAAIDQRNAAELAAVPADDSPDEPEESAGEDPPLTAVMPDLHKCGGKCGRDLPASAFWKNSRRKNGLYHKCKACASDDERDRRKARSRLSESQRAAARDARSQEMNANGSTTWE